LPAVVAPDSSVPIDVLYQPTAQGSITGTLEILSDAVNMATVTVDLSGTGQLVPVAQIEVQPVALAFGDVEIGSTQSQMVTLRNVGTANLTVLDLAVTGSDFALAQTPGLPAVIAPDSSVPIDVLYQPTAQGSITGTLEILSDAANAPTVMVSLNGTGQVTAAGQIDVQPAVLAYGEVAVGSNQSQIVTVSNIGTADLTVTALTVSGSDFALGAAPDLPAVILPGRSVPVVVIYQPSAEVAATGSLVIDSDAPDGPSVTVSLRGTGAPALIQQTTR
jgi:hypothetical protein